MEVNYGNVGKLILNFKQTACKTDQWKPQKK